MQQNAALQQQLAIQQQQQANVFIRVVADWVNGANFLVNAARSGNPEALQAMRDLHAIIQAAGTLSSIAVPRPEIVQEPGTGGTPAPGKGGLLVVGRG